MLQNATPLRKSATEPPNSPNISDKHVSCTAPATENASLQILFKCPMLAIVFGHALTSKCASRHNGVHFFDISTSKSGPELVCFVHVDFEMCFAPQRRALFRHLNFQKWSGAGVFCTCWLRNVLRATTACTFSTSQLLKVLRSWGVLYILTWQCASRHNGVHFFDVSTSKSGPNLLCFVHFASKCASRHNGVQLSHLLSGLRTRRCSEPTFRPSGATNHWKNTVFRGFPTFSRAWIFFLLRLYLFCFFPSFLLFFLSSPPLPCPPLPSPLLSSPLLFSSLLWLFPPVLFICP